VSRPARPAASSIASGRLSRRAHSSSTVLVGSTRARSQNKATPSLDSSEGGRTPFRPGCGAARGWWRARSGSGTRTAARTARGLRRRPARSCRRAEAQACRRCAPRGRLSLPASCIANRVLLVPPGPVTPATVSRRAAAPPRQAPTPGGETTTGGGQVGVVEALQRRELAPVELVKPDRRVHVLQPVLTQVGRLDLEQITRR
jgi:hypothetical protein